MSNYGYKKKSQSRSYLNHLVYYTIRFVVGMHEFWVRFLIVVFIHDSDHKLGLFNNIDRSFLIDAQRFALPWELMFIYLYSCLLFLINFSLDTYSKLLIRPYSAVIESTLYSHTLFVYHPF